MKAIELRLQNLVIDGNDIVEVNYRMIEMLVKKQAEFDPIPISEEKLLAFGFDKVGNKKLYYLNSFWIEYIDDDQYCFGIISENKKIPLSILKYIHELQNICFDLRGKKFSLKSIR